MSCEGLRRFISTGAVKLSQEKAAEIAGLNRTDFLLQLAREGENAFVVDFDDLKRELGT